MPGQAPLRCRPVVICSIHQFLWATQQFVKERLHFRFYQSMLVQAIAPIGTIKPVVAHRWLRRPHRICRSFLEPIGLQPMTLYLAAKAQQEYQFS